MTVVTINLGYFLLGACVGWLFARVLASVERRVLRLGVDMHPPERRHTLADAAAVVGAVTVAAGMAVYGVPATGDPSPLWDVSRELNKYVGPVVVACVLWRVIPMALDRRRWVDARAVHVLAWTAYICVSIGNSTAAAILAADPPGWTSFLRLLLNFTAIVLSVWWPHPVRLVLDSDPELVVERRSAA